MRQLGLFVPFVILVIGFAGHASTFGRTRLLVVNGQTVPPDDDATRAIFLVRGNGWCTGTFLNNSTLITAAHCIAHSAERPHLSVSGIHSLRVFENPKYVASRQIARTALDIDSQFDIAIAVFPEGTGSKLGIHRYYSLAGKRVTLRDVVEIVGYGLKDALKSEGAGLKRRGANAVKVAGGGLLGIFGPATQTTDHLENSSAAPGDSGGPLLDETGAIVGITSYSETSGPESRTQWSFFADALTRANLAFFRTTIDCGADVCAKDFVGDGHIAAVGASDYSDQCLIRPEILALKKLSDREESGELSSEDRSRFFALEKREREIGSCLECGAANGVGCLRHVEMWLYRRLSVERNSGALSRGSLARLVQIESRRRAFSFCGY